MVPTQTFHNNLHDTHRGEKHRGLEAVWAQVQARMPFSPWDAEKTTVCLTIAGSQVLDVNGNNFPAKQACITLDHR